MSTVAALYKDFNYTLPPHWGFPVLYSRLFRALTSKCRLYLLLMTELTCTGSMVQRRARQSQEPLLDFLGPKALSTKQPRSLQHHLMDPLPYLCNRGQWLSSCPNRLQVYLYSMVGFDIYIAGLMGVSNGLAMRCLLQKV
jgi:hypothetical protein